MSPKQDRNIDEAMDNSSSMVLGLDCALRDCIALLFLEFFILVLTITVVSSVASSNSSLGTSQSSLGESEALEIVYLASLASSCAILTMVDWLLLGAVTTSLWVLNLASAGMGFCVYPTKGCGGLNIFYLFAAFDGDFMSPQKTLSDFYKIGGFGFPTFATGSS